MPHYNISRHQCYIGNPVQIPILTAEYTTLAHLSNSGPHTTLNTEDLLIGQHKSLVNECVALLMRNFVHESFELITVQFVSSQSVKAEINLWHGRI